MKLDLIFLLKKNYDQKLNDAYYLTQI